MNKKVILSIALLSGITQNSYAKVPIRSLMYLSTVASSIRFGWLAGRSEKETAQEIAKDAATTMVADIKETVIAIKINGQEAYDWVEDTINGISDNNSNTPLLTAPPTKNPDNEPTELNENETSDPFAVSDK